MSKWISVKDNLPKHTHLVFYLTLEDSGSLHLSFYDIEDDCWKTPNNEVVQNVTYYMDLPKAPKDYKK